MFNLDWVNLKSKLTILVLFAAGVPLYWDTWAGMYYSWHSDNTYSHGPLIVLIYVFLLLQVEPTEKRKSTGVIIVASIALFVAGFLWLAAYLTVVQIIQASLVPILMFFALVVVYGRSIIVQLLFPTAFFFFAIPFWNVFTTVLQELTIFVNGAILDMLRIPAFIVGSLVYLPNGTFEIEAGCSGLHFFIVASALGSLYAHQNLISMKRRVLFFGISVFLSIIVNWVRVVTIVIAGYTTDMQHYLVRIDHYVFGWVVFALALIPLFIIGNKFCRQEDEIATENCREKPRLIYGFPSFRLFFLTLGLLAIAPLYARALDIVHDAQSVDQIQLQNVEGWRLNRDRVMSWQPSYKGTKDAVLAQYSTENFALDFYANLYLKQRQGAELVNQNNRLFDRREWQAAPAEIIAFSTQRRTDVEVAGVELSNESGRKMLIFSWYSIADKVFSEATELRWYELQQKLLGKVGSGIVVLRTDCDDNCDSERAVLTEFISINFDILNRTLTDTWTNDSREIEAKQ